MNPSKSQVYEERYLTHAQIQDALDECAEKGEPSSVLFVMRELFNKGYGTAVRPVVSGANTFEETIALTPLLESMMKKMFVPKPRRKNVRDSLLIPETSVCFCSRLFNHNFIPINAHDCFDVYYVWHGKCMIEFEDSSFMLEEGMVGIISPGSSYRADPTDHSDVFQLSIRTSTFENTFFSYLTTQNLLSVFSRSAVPQKAASELSKRADPGKNRHELYAACAQFPDDRSKKNASGHKRSDREHCPAGRLYKSGYFYQSFQKRNRHDAYALSPAKPKLLRASF